jgi:hypothetical protein
MCGWDCNLRYNLESVRQQLRGFKGDEPLAGHSVLNQVECSTVAAHSSVRPVVHCGIGDACQFRGFQERNIDFSLERDPAMAVPFPAALR